MEKIYQFYDHINVLVKPTNGCNLRCIYCFHQDFGYDTQFLSNENLIHFFEITFPFYKSINIIWHGGEPTFVGDKKFREYIEITDKYAKKYNIKLTQMIQTNGTLLNQHFIDILKKYNIGFGVSYDGPINQYTRCSTSQFLKARELVLKNDLNFGVISVISGANINNLKELYEEMKQLNCSYQMNHYVDTSDNPSPNLLITSEQYLIKMKKFFDYWINDDTCQIYVDPFIRIITDVYNGYSSLCARSSCMRNWLCMESNGELTPCDRDFPNEFRYGHVTEFDDIRKIYNSKGFTSLMEKAVIRRRKCKAECDVFDLCRGGCNNNALYESGIENNGGISCEITKGLIRYIKDRAISLELFKKPELIKNPIVRNTVLNLIKKG